MEAEGLLKTQASLLAQLTSSHEEVKKLVENKSFLELTVQARRFTDLLLADANKAYLQVSFLAGLAVEKAEQERLFDLLSLLLAEKMTDALAREKMDAVLEAKKMWQANVSLQNSLEYMTLI